MDDYFIKPLSQDTMDDFFRLFDNAECAGCYCMYWEWEGPDEEWPEMLESGLLRQVKMQLIIDSVTSGLLLYHLAKPVGWVQLGHRSHFQKHNNIEHYSLTAQDDVWCLTCFYIQPEHRKKGLARMLLDEACQIFADREAEYVEVYPRIVEETNLPDQEMWTGPYQMYLDAGFEVYINHPQWPVLRNKLND